MTRYKVTIPPSSHAVYSINGEEDVNEECNRLDQLIAKHPTDMDLVGIEKNINLAWKDPPADLKQKSHILLSN